MNLGWFCMRTDSVRSLRFLNLFWIGQKFWKDLTRYFPFFSSRDHSATLLYPRCYREVESILILWLQFFCSFSAFLKSFLDRSKVLERSHSTLSIFFTEGSPCYTFVSQMLQRSWIRIITGLHSFGAFFNGCGVISLPKNVCLAIIYFCNLKITLLHFCIPDTTRFTEINVISLHL